MEIISAILRWLFTYLVYPAIIIGIFAFVIGTIVYIVNSKKADTVRTAVAAIIPVVALVFLIVSERTPSQSLMTIFENVGPVAKFFVGAIAGSGLTRTRQAAA